MTDRHTYTKPRGRWAVNMLMEGTNCCKPSGIPACLLYVIQRAWLGSLGSWSPIGHQSQTVNIPEEEDAIASLCTHGSIIHKVLYLTQEKKTLLISSL